MKRTLWLSLTAIVTLLALKSIWGSASVRPRQIDLREPLGATRDASLPTGRAFTLAARQEPQPQLPPVTTRPAVSWDAAKALATLRTQLDIDPLATLIEARQTQSQLADQQQAAECEWIIVRALSRLARGDEARFEAAQLAQEHAGSPWALDVERHVLAVPP
jgi:hypothetical protein